VLDHGVLARHPFYPDAPRESGHIPMIIGNTHDETKAFLGGDPKNFALTWEELPSKLDNELVLDMSPEYLIAKYRQLYPNYSPSDCFFAITTAGRSWPGHLIQAEQRARIGAPAWMYQLDFGSQTDPARWAPTTATTSPWCSARWTPRSRRPAPGRRRAKVRESDERAFVNFARTGDPNGAAIPAWEQYTLPKRADPAVQRDVEDGRRPAQGRARAVLGGAVPEGRDVNLPSPLVAEGGPAKRVG
jgi:para-nitrobenzyl esterase